MTLFARPSDADLLAKLERQRPSAVAVPDRKCEFCKTAMSAADVTCPKCYREPLEKSEQAEVVKLYRAYGCHVYNLSQARASKQTPGLPDLYVFRPPHAWWHETKRPISGHPSPAQKVFNDECFASFVNHTIGGLAAARGTLVRIGAARWVRDPGGAIEPAHVDTLLTFDRHTQP